MKNRKIGILLIAMMVISSIITGNVYADKKIEPNEYFPNYEEQYYSEIERLKSEEYEMYVPEDFLWKTDNLEAFNQYLNEYWEIGLEGFISDKFIVYENIQELASDAQKEKVLLFRRTEIVPTEQWDTPCVLEDNTMFLFSSQPFTIIAGENIIEVEETVNLEKYYNSLQEFYLSWKSSDGIWFLDQTAFVEMAFPKENELLDWFSFVEGYNLELPISKVYYPDVQLFLTIHRDSKKFDLEPITLEKSKVIIFDDITEKIEIEYESIVKNDTEKLIENPNENNIIENVEDSIDENVDNELINNVNENIEDYVEKHIEIDIEENVKTSVREKYEEIVKGEETEYEILFEEDNKIISKSEETGQELIVLDKGSDYQLMLRPEIDKLIASEEGIKIIKLQGESVQMETDKYLVELIDDELTILDKEKGSEVDIDGIIPDSLETSGGNDNITNEEQIEDLDVLDSSELGEILLSSNIEVNKDIIQDNEQESSVNEAEILMLYYLAFGLVAVILIAMAIYIKKTYFNNKD